MATRSDNGDRAGHRHTPDPALRTAAVASELDVSIRTVERLISRGDLPALRIGRQLRVRRSALEAYLDTCEATS